MHDAVDADLRRPARSSRQTHQAVHSTYTFHAVDPAAAYGDLGYHFLIDEAGRVYEGRFSGVDGFPAHDELERHGQRGPCRRVQRRQHRHRVARRPHRLRVKRTHGVFYELTDFQELPA